MQRALVMVVRALTNDTVDLDTDTAGGEGEDGVRGMKTEAAADYVRTGMRKVLRQLGQDPRDIEVA